MTYANPAMKSGDLIFRQGTKLNDLAIEAWTDSPLSHCGVIYEFTTGLMVMQAVDTGVGPVTIDHFLSLGKCWWIKTGVTWSHDAEAAMIKLVGQPYSYLAEEEVAFGMTPPAGAEICTTLAAQILGFCGLNIPTRGLTPAKLAAFFTAQGKALTSI